MAGCRVVVVLFVLVLAPGGSLQQRRVRPGSELESDSLVGPGVRDSEGNIVKQAARESRGLEEEAQEASPTPQSVAPLAVVSSRPRGEGSQGSQVAALLQRLGERVSALHTLAEQQTRRLEGLDYRLTRLEVQGQERGEATRAAVAETARHVQQLAYQGGLLASAVESLRQGQAEQRQALAAPPPAPPHQASPEVLAKLQGLSSSVQAARVALVVLQENTALLVRNFSALANVTRVLREGQSQLLSRHAFSSALADLRYSASPHWTPACVSSAAPPGVERLPTDCAEVMRDGQNQSGVFRVQPAGKPFFVFCELEARGGGWTVLQHRFEGGVDFYRDWLDYKHGFGNLGGEFWLGLDKMHQLTGSKVNELMVELQDFTMDTAHAHYSAFAVGPEVEGFPLSFLTGYEGDAGDSLAYHAGMKFSTRDVDHDQWPDGSCAETHLGAWWYNGCDTSNLNGRYLNGALPESHESQGMYWYDWRGPAYSLMGSRLMVRPRRAAGPVGKEQKGKRGQEGVSSKQTKPKNQGRPRVTTPATPSPTPDPS